MPSRKNRPDKFRGQRAQPPYDAVAMQLVRKLQTWELKNPKEAHYVGWPDMSAAKRLEKLGYLRESTFAMGCFFLADLFHQDFPTEAGNL